MATLKESSLTAIIDTREQAPFDLAKFGFGKIERKALDFGDYSIKGLESLLCIERKSLADLILSITRTRKTMDKRISAMRGYRYAYLIIEASASDILDHKYRGKTSELAVIGTLAKYQSCGISVINSDNAYFAARICARLLYFVAREVYSYAHIFSHKQGGK